MEESDCDAFDTGHSSTSISVALGMVKARDLRGGNNKVVAVLGDGALTGGMAFEALNNAGRLKSNLIIILNDNNMSITECGRRNKLSCEGTNTKYTEFKESMEEAITKIPGGKDIVNRLKRSKDAIKYFILPSMFCGGLDLPIGPINGNDIDSMLSAYRPPDGLIKQWLSMQSQKGKGICSMRRVIQADIMVSSPLVLITESL